MTDLWKYLFETAVILNIRRAIIRLCRYTENKNRIQLRFVCFLPVFELFAVLGMGQKLRQPYFSYNVLYFFLLWRILKSMDAIEFYAISYLSIRFSFLADILTFFMDTVVICLAVELLVFLFGRLHQCFIKNIIKARLSDLSLIKTSVFFFLLDFWFKKSFKLRKNLIFEDQIEMIPLQILDNLYDLKKYLSKFANVVENISEFLRDDFYLWSFLSQLKFILLSWFLLGTIIDYQISQFCHLKKEMPCTLDYSE